MDNDLFPDIAERISSLSEKLPPYLERHGLEHPPFDGSYQDDFYFEEPIRTQRFNLLLHLAQFSDLLHLITGPKDSGKSALLQRLEQQAHELWKCCRIQGSKQTTIEEIFTQLAETIDVSENTPVSQLSTAITEQLNSFFFTTRRAVLLIDDAHLLPDTTLRQLISFCERKNEEGKTLLHLILAGEAAIQEKVSQLLTHIPEEKQLNTLTLSPFTLAQTRDYINHRMECAGLEQDSPFHERDIRTIYKESSGLPGRINKLAHQHLLIEPNNKLSAALLLQAIKPKQPLAWVAVGVIIAMVVPTIIYQDEINNLFEPKEEPLVIADTLDQRLEKPLGLPLANVVEKQQAKVTETEPATVVAPESTPIQTEQDAVDDDQLAQNDETTATAPDQVIPASSSITEEAMEEISTIESPIVGIQTAEIGKPAPEKVAPPQATAQASENDGMIWIRQQKGSRYTLQLIATANKGSIEKFIAQNNLDSQPIAIYNTLRDEKPWYGLVYGSYTNRLDAQAASEKLKKEINNLEPWPRSFSSIHQLLK